MNNSTAKIKICPSCGATFECLHNVECWCFTYKISKENLEKIRNQFNDCLCERCLSAYATETNSRDF